MARTGRRSSIRIFFDDTDAPTTTDKKPKYVIGDIWRRGSTNQFYALVDADAGTWVELRGPTASALPHVLSVDFTMTADTSAVISRYVEVSSAMTLSIPSGSDLEIT